MNFRFDESKVDAMIELEIMRNTQLSIDSIDKDQITPSKVLYKYVSLIIKDAYSLDRGGNIHELIKSQDPESWEEYLMDVCDSLNYRATFGITTIGMDREAIEIATQSMSGEAVLNVDEYYRNKLLNK